MLVYRNLYHLLHFRWLRNLVERALLLSFVAACCVVIYLKQRLHASGLGGGPRPPLRDMRTNEEACSP
jgi:hypothetical protein